MPPVRATRGRRRTQGAAAALALAACLLSSCGEDSSTGLSQQRASTLRSTLDGVEARVARSDCGGASEQASAFRSEVESLPARVDGDLRDALERSAARLESLVARQCGPQSAAPVEEPPAQEPPAADENAGDRQGQGGTDKKPKKQKPRDEQQPPQTGENGQEGSAGVTGPSGGTTAPGGE